MRISGALLCLRPDLSTISKEYSDNFSSQCANCPSGFLKLVNDGLCVEEIADLRDTAENG